MVCVVWVRSPHHSFESGEVAKHHHIWYDVGPALEDDAKRIALFSVKVRILLVAGTLSPQPGREQRPHCGHFLSRVIYSVCALPNCSSKRAGKISCFLPGMALYQCVQFSEEETHNSFFEQDTQGKWRRKRGVGPSRPLSPSVGQASESLRAWHAKQMWSTTEKAGCAFSLNVLRQEDEA